MLCPICQRPTSDIIQSPYVYGNALTLAQKITPDWQPADGACRMCVESILDTVGELEDAKAEQHPSAIGFREHYRHTLTDREHRQWHHVNADMQRWRQNQIVERVADCAQGAGYDCWIVIDSDETLLAQGVAG